MWYGLPPSTEAAAYDAKLMESARARAEDVIRDRALAAKSDVAQLLRSLAAEGDDFVKESQKLAESSASCTTTYAWICSLQDWRPVSDQRRKKLMTLIQDAVAWEIISCIDSFDGPTNIDELIARTLFSPIFNDETIRSQLKHACTKATRALGALGLWLQWYCTASASEGRHKPRRRAKKSKQQSGPEIQMQNQGQDNTNSSSQRASEAEDDVHMDSISVKAFPPHADADTRSKESTCAYEDHTAKSVRAGSDVTASALYYPGAAQTCPQSSELSLAPGTWSRHPLESVLDEAYKGLNYLISEARPCDSRRANQWNARTLFNQVPQWQEQARQQCHGISVDDTITVTTRWIRNAGDAAGGSDPTENENETKRIRELQTCTLLVIILFRTEHVLPVIENTHDDSLSVAVYGAISEFSVMGGMSDEKAQEVVERILALDPTHYGPDSYGAYMALLGQLLQGTAKSWVPKSWELQEDLANLHSCQDLEHARTHRDLRNLATAISKVINIAGWWHRNRFHEEKTAKLLEQAFASLLRMFDSCKSLGIWEPEICILARWCIFNYSHIDTALDNAKDLLHMGGGDKRH